MDVPPSRPGRHLTVSDTAPIIEFYSAVFGATPIEQECLLDGRVLNATVAVAGYHLTLSEWYGTSPPAHVAAGAAVLTLPSADPQLLLERALAAGAELEDPVDGSAGVVFRDPAGQRWRLVESVTPGA